MLVEFHEDWCKTRLPKAKGRRAQQLLAKRLGLPIIRAGNSVLIDDQAGDDRLRVFTLHQEKQRGRGRPRTSL